jgi:hypothetical protein
MGQDANFFVKQAYLFVLFIVKACFYIPVVEVGTEIQKQSVIEKNTL